MKNILYIAIGLVLASFALSGCTRFQEEDFFEESAALRIEHSSENLLNILVNAPQGWVIQYYTGDSKAGFEGFNLFAKFERGGKVTLAGNHRFLRDGNAGKYTEASSLYELIREDGLVLAFDSWNDVLTPFVDPVAYGKAPEELEKDGVGMEGDQNLVVTFMSENELRFRGERHNAKIRMVKAERDWQTYINDTEAMKNLITSEALNSYYITTGNKTMYCVGLRDGRYRVSDQIDKKDASISYSVSCCFTPTGFRNEHPDTLDGHVFQEFKMNEDGTALVNEDGNVRFTATWDTYIAENTEVMWMDPATMSADLRAMYDQLAAALQTISSSYSLLRVGIGNSQTVQGKDMANGLVIEWKPGKRLQPKTGGMAMKRSVPAMGQITITYADNAKIDEELKGTMNATVENAVRALGVALAGTYEITANSNFVPTAALFQSVDSEKSFYISSETAE